MNKQKIFKKIFVGGLVASVITLTGIVLKKQKNKKKIILSNNNSDFSDDSIETSSENVLIPDDVNTKKIFNRINPFTTEKSNLYNQDVFTEDKNTKIKDMSLEEVCAEYKEEKLINWITEKNTYYHSVWLYEIPEQYRTEKVCLSFFTGENGIKNIYYVPQKLLTFDFCLQAIKSVSLKAQTHAKECSYILSFCKEKELIVAMLLYDGCYQSYQNGFIKELFEEYKELFTYNDRLILTGKYLYLFPTDWINEEILLEFTKTKSVTEIGEIIKKYENVIDDNTVLSIVKTNARVFAYLPMKFKKNPKIYKIALENYPLSIRNIPLNERNIEMYITVINSDERVLKFVPQKFKTKELYENIVRQNGMFIAEVPTEFKTSELEKEAVKNTVDCIPYISLNNVTKEQFQEFVSQPIRYIYNGKFSFLNNSQEIPEHIITAEIVERIIENGFFNFNLLPLKFVTDYFIEKAIEKSFYRQCYPSLDLLPLIPVEKLNENICLKAIAKNPNEMKYLPSELQTPNFYSSLIYMNEKVIRYIPEHQLNIELCKKFFECNRNSMNEFPTEIQVQLNKELVKGSGVN